jgi:hypothetical protein
MRRGARTLCVASTLRAFVSLMSFAAFSMAAINLAVPLSDTFTPGDFTSIATVGAG